MSDTRMLPVKLTEEEVLARGRKLAALAEKRDRVLAARKIAVESSKEEEGSLVADMLDVREQINTGKEKRPVDVVERLELETRSIVTYRDDTGERVDSRVMNDLELREALQTSLPLCRVDSTPAHANNGDDVIITEEDVQMPSKRSRKGAKVVDKSGGDLG